MRKFLFYSSIFFLFFISEINAQHYIGLDKAETKLLARKAGFYPDDMTVNQKFNYSKFVNSADTKTLIVFFSEQDIATHTRMVCDYSEYDFVRIDFDKEFKKKNKNLWEYKLEGKSFEITLEEKEWYFVLRTKKKL